MTARNIIIVLFGLFFVTNATQAQNITTYYFDNQNRLVKSTNEATSFKYSFDKLGNRLSYIITSSLAQQADLIVENVSILENTIAQGTELMLTCDLSNNGLSDAVGSHLKVFLSNTTTGTETELLSKYVSGIKAGESISLNLKITIPTDAEIGNKYLVLFADANALITELNDNNNKANIPVTIQAQISSDLTIQEQQINPASLYAGESTYVTANLMNIGTENAAGFDFRCYLSSNPTFETYNDLELNNAAYSISSLDAGATIPYARNINLPSNTVPGIYYLLFVIDPENTISEQNKDNNILSSVIIILSQSGGSVPMTDFLADDQSIGIGTKIQFTDNSTNNPLSWQWLFPGGTPSFSTVQNPSITYYTTGKYDVSLTTSNSAGSNTKSQSEYVSVGQEPEYDWLWSKFGITDIEDLTLDLDGNIVVGGGSQYAKFDPDGTEIWSNFINCNVRALDVNLEGDIIIVGEFSGTVDFGNNVTISNTYNDGTDGFIAKFDKNGLCIWANKIYNSDVWNAPNSQVVRIMDVCFDNSGNSYIVGHFEGLYGGTEHNFLRFPNGISLQNFDQGYNLVVAKFSSSGSTVWAKQGEEYNNSTCYFQGVSIDTDGTHVGVVGSFSGSAVFNNQSGSVRTASGIHDIFFIECSTSDGYMNAFNKYGSSSTNTSSWDQERANDIKYLENGSKYICGQFTGNSQFEVFQRTSVGHADMFLMKLYSSCSIEWIATGGSTNFDCGNDISIAPGGNVYIVGQHDVGLDMAGVSVDGYGTFLGKFTSGGSLINANNILSSFYNDNHGGGIEADLESSLYFGSGNVLAKYGKEKNTLHPVLQCTNENLCQNDSSLITAPDGFADYNWSNGDTTSAIFVHASGDYYVFVTDANGDTGYSDTLSIKVYDAPTANIVANGATRFCEGSYVELNANIDSELTYKWIKNEEYIDGAIDDNFFANIKGNYQVEVNNKGNCPVKSNTIQITVNQPPTANAGMDAIISGIYSYQLSGTATNEEAVLWSTSGDGVFSNASELLTQYTIGTEDFNTGYVILTLTAYAILPCENDFVDEMVLTIEQELPEGWTINPSEYTYDGEVTAEVFIDDDTTEAGILAAFVDGICRGVMSEPQRGPTNKLIYIMRVYSDQASGENIEFKFLENSEDGIMDIQEEIPFNSDMTIGTAIAPFEMNAYTYLDFSKSMTSGWNWFSVYLENDSMALDQILSTLNPQAGDYIKDRKGTGNSSTFYDQSGFKGWYGTLSELDPKETYKIKLNNAGEMAYQGSPFDFANEVIPVNAGWNWIGYPLSTEMSVSDYLNSLTKVENDYIKDQLVSSTYYSGYGWYGQLENMQPGNGYVLKVANSGSISGADFSNLKSIDPMVSKSLTFPKSEYFLNARDFEFSGSASIEVFIDGKNAGADGNILYAFNQNGICVGIINGLYYPMTDKYLYNLMMYSNAKQGDEIHFKFFNSEENNWYSFTEQMIFEYDMVVADAYHPFELKSSIKEENQLPDELDIKVYPNPFKQSLTYSFILNEDTWVRISVLNTSGQTLELLKDQMFSKGHHQNEWSTSNLKEGLYLIRFEMEAYNKIVPIIKTN